MQNVAWRNQVIPANEYQRVRWKNGHGWTREIACLGAPPADGPDRAAVASGASVWDWRLSIAEIERDAPFSSFPGIERELVLLRGEGLQLTFGDGRMQTLRPPHERIRFAGEEAVHGALVDGPTHDFNLMWRRGQVQAELLHRPLVGPMLFFAGPGSGWAIHLLAGQARFDAASGLPPLRQGDTALLLSAGERQRTLLDGGGEVLLVRLGHGDGNGNADAFVAAGGPDAIG